MARRPSILLVAAAALIALPVVPAQAAPMYPDIETLAPRELDFDEKNVNPDGPGPEHDVLRFSNTVVNGGQGDLEVGGRIDSATRTGDAVQRIYDSAGGSRTERVGEFYWHAAPGHNHYHFDDWGRYELYEAADYPGGTPMVGTKTTSCVMDEEFIRTLPGTPFPAEYPSSGCFPNSSGLMRQGISPGWGDTYDYWRFEQWIDLGPASGGPGIADGRYVLRSVTDPSNNIYESAGKSGGSESQSDNEGIRIITVSGGNIVDSDKPTGTVAINDVDAATVLEDVKVKVIGRDDVLGPGAVNNVDRVRISNKPIPIDGSGSSTHSYTTTGSAPTSINWDLTNPAFGGTSANGTKTVYVQFHDRSGKWSDTHTDTIVLNQAGGGPPPPPPPEPVAAPSDLTASVASASAIALAWTDNSLDETEFVLERDTSSGFGSPASIPISENAISYTDTGRSASTKYYYRLKALNASAESGWSNTVTATTSAAPVVPPPPPPAPSPAAPSPSPAAPASASPPAGTPPAGSLPDMAPPAKPRFTRSKRSIRVDRKGRLSYTFRASPGLFGTARFATAKRVRVSTRKRKRVTLAVKPFTVPSGGKTKLRIRLSKKNLRILKRNRKLVLKVKVTVVKANGRLASATTRLTLRAPRRR